LLKNKKVVSNSSPLIALSRINKLSLLQDLFEQVIIPSGVYNEIVERGRDKKGSKEVKSAEWITIYFVKDKDSVRFLVNSQAIGIGESEAIVACKELNADLLLMDDKLARNVAKQYLKDTHLMGTIGILFFARQLRLIKSVEENLNELLKNKFRISPKLYKKILELEKNLFEEA